MLFRSLGFISVQRQRRVIFENRLNLLKLAESFERFVEPWRRAGRLQRFLDACQASSSPSFHHAPDGEEAAAVKPLSANGSSSSSTATSGIAVPADFETGTASIRSVI